MILLIACLLAQPAGDPFPPVEGARIDLRHLRLTSGFSDAGSYAGIRVQAAGFSLSLEQGLRRGKAEFGFTHRLGSAIEASVAFYGQRLQINQSRETSLFAFDRDARPVFDLHALRYRVDSYGLAASTNVRLSKAWRAGVRYNYDISTTDPKSQAAADFFFRNFREAWNPQRLEHIRTSTLTPSLTYDTVDSPLRPSRGTALLLSTGVSGLGGEVKMVEPAAEVKLFRSVHRKQVAALRVRGRMMIPYGDGFGIPQYSRYFAGGESEVRGFDSWSSGPFVSFTGMTRIAVLNPDGSPRMIRTLTPDGTIVLSPLTQTIPVRRVIAAGGDTKVTANFEYRIPLGSGPFTFILFQDLGLNRIAFRDQLDPSGLRRDLLRQLFPELTKLDVAVAPGAERVRMSSGAELQFLPARLQIPLRVYAAWNPLTYRGIPEADAPFDRSLFPNNATYLNAIGIYRARQLEDRRFMLRFSIGRTF